MKIHVQRDGKNFGPYPLDTVKRYLSEGSLSPRDLAWHKGIESWVRLGEIVEVEAPPDLPPPDLPTPAGPPPAVQAPVTEPLAPTPDPVPAEPMPEGRVDFFAALTFPFKQNRWLVRAWWVPFINFFPPLSWLAMRGWRLDIVKRVADRSAEPLPDGRDVGKFLANGLILYFMVFLYTLPLTIVLYIFGATKIKLLAAAGWVAIKALFAGDGWAAFTALATQFLMKLLVESVVPFVYLFLFYPVYRMAVIRFALTGRPVVFFQLVRNLRLFFRFMADMMLLFLLDVMVMRFMRWGLNVALLATGFGFVLVPAVSAPAYFWVTGHLFGQVAMKVKEDELALF